MDSIAVGVIRKKIYQYYKTEKEVPTLTELVEILHENNLNYCREYLKELLHKIGYRYLRCRSPSRRHILVEESGLECKRLDYLDRIKEYRAQNRNIYFMYESYMEARDVAKRGNRCLEIAVPTKIAKKERLIIVHTGGPNGLLSGSFTTVKSDSETGDHFGEVNMPKFEKWVTDNLKHKLQPNSVIVISSASHRSIQKDKRPRDLWTLKSDMQDWLKRRNIAFEKDLSKIELLQLIRKAQAKPVYVIDEALKHLGHTVLRLPPCHPELNPLTYIWADIKKKIADSHVGAPLEEKRKIWSKLYSESSVEWQKWEDSVRNTENEYIDKAEKFDDMIDDIIERYEKDLNSDSEEWESDKSDESESDSE